MTTTSRRRAGSKNKEEIKELISPSDVSDEEIKPPNPPSKETTLQKVLTRTILGFCMVGYYLSMLRGGHMYCILTGVLTQVTFYLTNPHHPSISPSFFDLFFHFFAPSFVRSFFSFSFHFL